MYAYTGNIHIHSTYSDGTGSISEIAEDAKKADLDFIIITDHNTLQGLAEEGFYNGVLVLCGHEINTSKNHFLALNTHTVIPENDNNPQEVIDAVNAQNGLGFIAHPDEKGSPLVLGGRTYPWDDWNATGFTGIEVWNYCSQWRDGITNLSRGLFYAYLNPTGPITGPCPQTLARFDEITQHRKLTAIAGTDAHNWPVRYGPIHRNIFPYEYLFRTACNTVLLPEPLSQDLSTAKAQIYNALRHGHAYIINRQVGDPAGFDFTVSSKNHQYLMGDEAPFTDTTFLNIQCPSNYRGRIHIRIVHNGKTFDEINRCNVAVRVYTPGVYRLEIYKNKTPWIWTNPIYLT